MSKTDWTLNNWESALLAAPVGHVVIGPTGSLTYVSSEAAALIGYEGMGPQKTDAPTPPPAPEPEAGWDGHPEDRARALDKALTALHRQHTYNGRPPRYLPEVK